MSAAAESEEFSHFFEVRIEEFSGPIDLLLHLVKLRELPVEKLSLAIVADQYLECLEQLGKFDLEVAGEYLVIAATLLSIKSTVLLDDPLELVLNEDGDVIDPHDELLQRLREAEVFKEGARAFEEIKLLGYDVFSPPSQLRSFPSVEPEYQNHDPILLGSAFRKLIDTLSEDVQYTVTLEPVSVVETMMRLVDTLRQGEEGRIFFRLLIPDLTSRSEIIATFIGLLELCRRQIISVEQEEGADDVTVVLGVNKDFDEKFFSEYEIEEKEGVAYD